MLSCALSPLPPLPGLEAHNAPAAPQDPAANLSRQPVLDPEGAERLDEPELKTYYVLVNVLELVQCFPRLSHQAP